MKPSILSALVVTALAIATSAHAEDGWKNESQAGIVTTTGNTDTSTFSLGEIASYTFDANIVKINGAYLSQKSAGVLSGKSWSLGLRYERVLNEQLSLFVAQSVEGNQFAGVNQRYNTDVGAKHSLVKNEELSWFVEAGYRFTKENLRLISRNLHYARAYTELEKKFSPTVSAKYWLEYLPNFTVTDNWQLNTELSLSAAISSVFSVKSAYLIRFDNQVNAPGLVQTDKTFTTSLVAKF